jgi:glucokinase
VSTPVVLGLDFGGTKVAAAVSSADDGRLRGEATVATDPARGARWNLEHGIRAALRLLDDVVPGRPPVAVAATTFGIPREAGVALAPAIPGWEELALGKELALAFECDAVEVVTDVKAAAAVEARDGALAGHDPGLYLNLGTGLAAAIVCDGLVVTGANGAAGEIGYNLVRRDGDAQLSMLEHLVSGIGLAATAKRRGGGALSAEQVFLQAEANPQLAALVEEFVDELGFHLVNLAVAVDPSRIAVGGGMVRSWPRLEGPLRRALDESVPFPPELVVGAFPYDAALRGAVSLAVETAAGGMTKEGERASMDDRRNGAQRRPESVTIESTVARRPRRDRT